MPPVIRLSKGDLNEFARVVVLANTPLSLFRGMAQAAGIEKLRRLDPGDLVAYYDRLTARAGRSEIVVGLAYAILCAAVLQRRDAREIGLDASRLQWGQRIWDFMSRTDIGTRRIVVPANQLAPPTVSSLHSPSSDTLILGADGRPLRRRDLE